MSEWNSDQFRTAIRRDIRLRWKDQLQEMERQSTPKKTRMVWRPYVIAASLLLLVAVGLWYFLQSPPSTTQDLFTQYFQVPMNVSQPSIRKPDIENSISKAFRLYEEKAYIEAIEVFNKLEETELEMDGFFYRGISHLASAQGNMAIKDLNKVLQGDFKTSAEWYLALAYLQTKEVERSKEQLEKIQINNTHPYQNQAVRLLAALNKK